MRRNRSIGQVGIKFGARSPHRRALHAAREEMLHHDQHYVSGRKRSRPAGI